MKKLVIAKGLDELSMVRVFMHLDISNKNHQTLAVNNGMVLPCIVVGVKYTDNVISVFATPIIPFSFTYSYVFSPD